MRWGTRLAAAADSLRRYDVRGHVLFRGRRCGRNQSRRNACGPLRDLHRFPRSGQQDRRRDARLHREVPEALARRSADSRRSSSAFHLHLLAENSAGHRDTSAQVPGAHPDSCGRNDKELDDSRLQNGTTPVQYLEKLGILARASLQLTASLSTGRSQNPRRTQSRLRAQSVEQHDAGQRRLASSGNARSRRRCWPWHRWARGQQQRPGLDGRNGPRREAREDHQDGSVGAQRQSCRRDGHH